MSTIVHDDAYYMQLAIEKCLEGIAQGQAPFGACIVLNDEIVVCEHNRVWETTDSTAHAEIVAIRAACKKLKTIDLSGAVLYSTTEPCPMCFSASHWACVKRIVYGATIADAHAAGFHELPIAAEQMNLLGKSGIILEGSYMIESCRHLFKVWGESKYPRKY